MVRSQSHPAILSNNDIGQLPFRFRQAIKKPLAFHRHIVALTRLQLVIPPRMRSIFLFSGNITVTPRQANAPTPHEMAFKQFRMARFFIDYLRETRARACNAAKATRSE